jgi:hypothetical protein
MQKWEYLLLDTDGGRDKLPRFLNGIEIRNWRRGPSLVEFINQLGDQGWELVSWQPHYYGESTVEVRVVFKRPKP